MGRIVQLLLGLESSSSKWLDLERRQPEWVAAVLDSEHAQKEGVHSQENSAPEEDCELLPARVCDARDLEGKADGREGEDAV